MKKIKVTEKSGKIALYTGDESSKALLESYPIVADNFYGSILFSNNDELLEKLTSLGHGLPERWVCASRSEPYDPADVLESEERILTPAIEAKEAVLDEEGNVLEPAIEAVPAVTETWVKLKAEYTIEIVDLTQDPEYLLQQCHAKRQAEYPSLGEFADAYVKQQQGDSTQMEAYVAKCMAVKAKHPKP